MLKHVINTVALSAHLPRAAKPGIADWLISGNVHQKYKAPILPSPFKRCLQPHLTVHSLLTERFYSRLLHSNDPILTNSLKEPIMRGPHLKKDTVS